MALLDVELELQSMWFLLLIEMMRSSLNKFRLRVLNLRTFSGLFCESNEHFLLRTDFRLRSNFHTLANINECRLWRFAIFNEFPMEIWRILSHLFKVIWEQHPDVFLRLPSFASCPLIDFWINCSCTFTLIKLRGTSSSWSEAWLVHAYWDPLTYVADGGRIFR